MVASMGVPVECIQCGLSEQIDFGQRRAEEVKVGQRFSLLHSSGDVLGTTQTLNPTIQKDVKTAFEMARRK